ncbi:unnamed protein product [Prorocentrum cordatum]|uniref:Uncharacterized protein n=1 Tax=Prorocentrum cordatum TaxID=2364126 RepID=A0ABN9P9Z6_9DINO|nr:unnamed protein product [Polarella glacialis]CAK0816934.1 unnamed protein product [Polarella glacialis]
MPISIKDGFVAIAADENTPRAKTWFAKKVSADNRTWVLCDRLDSGFRHFCSNGFDMLDEMHRKRSEKCDPLIAAVQEPAEDAEAAPPAAKVAKKDALDMIAGYVSITVTDEWGLDYTMNVRSAAMRRSHLHIELPPENLAALTMKPQDVQGPSEWEPTLADGLVTWLGYRHALSVPYFDADKAKWLNKSMKVPTLADEAAMQSAAEKVAAALLEWRHQHRTEPPKE